MKLRILSDIHNEFYRESFHSTRLYNENEDPQRNSPNYLVPETEDEKNTVLILAGDIDTDGRIVEFAATVNHRFKHVILVLGNHDYWSGHITRTPDKVKSRLKLNDVEVYDYDKCIHKTVNLSNVTLLHNDELVIDGVRFIGGTLWTDLNNGDPLTSWDARRKMNDYRYIRSGASYTKLTPAITKFEHMVTREFITNKLDEKFDGKTVVVTHHAPCEKSICGLFSHDTQGNYNYFTDLTNLFEKGVDLWVHGHTHEEKDYEVYGTRVVCNPLGYIGEGVQSDPKLIVEV